MTEPEAELRLLATEAAEEDWEEARLATLLMALEAEEPVVVPETTPEVEGDAVAEAPRVI